MISPSNPNPKPNPRPNPNPNSKASGKDGFSSFQHHTDKISRVAALSFDRDSEPPRKKSFLSAHRPRRDDEGPLAGRRGFTGNAEGNRGSDLKSVEFRRDGKMNDVDVAKKTVLGLRRIHHPARVEVNNGSLYREEFCNGNKASVSDRKISGGGDLLVEREGFVLRIRNSRSNDEELRGTIGDVTEYKGSGFAKRPSSAKGLDKSRRDSNYGNRILLKRPSKALGDLNGGEEVSKSLASGIPVRKNSESLAISTGEGDTSTRSLNTCADSAEEAEKSLQVSWDHEFSIDFSRIIKKARTHRHRRRSDDKVERNHKFLEATGETGGLLETQEDSATDKADNKLNGTNSHCEIAEVSCLKSVVLHVNGQEVLAKTKGHISEDPEKIKEDNAVIISDDNNFKKLDVAEVEVFTEELVKQSENIEVTKHEGNPYASMTEDTVEQRVRNATMPPINQEMTQGEVEQRIGNAALSQEMIKGVDNVQDNEIVVDQDDGINNVQHSGATNSQDDETDNVVDEEANDAPAHGVKYVQDNLDPKPSIPIVSGKPENPKDRWLQDFLHERVLEKERHAAQSDDEHADFPPQKEPAISRLNGADGDRGEVPGSNKQEDPNSEEMLRSSVNLQCEIDNGDKVDNHGGHFRKQAEPMMGSFQLSLGLPLASVASERSEPPFVVTASLETSHNLSHSLLPTNSDGFTTCSFSSSHSFMHNQSCSLNYVSEGQQLSSGCSREVTKGHEQSSQQKAHQVPSISDCRLMRHDRNVIYQHSTKNLNTQGILTVVGRPGGNNVGHHFGQSLQVISDDGQEEYRKQSVANKTFFENPHHEEFRQLTSNKEFAQATNSRPPAARDQIQLASQNTNMLNEKFGLHEIVTEPVAMMAQKMQELPESVVEGLKRLTKDLLGDFEKREEFFMLQKKIKCRTDLTERTLLHANMAQLEIFIALKTGLQDYVKEGNRPLTYKVLIEILLDRRCPNIACKQMLPVNGCECRICSRKCGFCSECMCVVCYKFDSDNGSCQWVGCDACEHWCHADCALRKSHIITGDAKSVGMQYCCVSCDRHCDLFGFVKGVFQNVSHGWNADDFLKELDCVRRIFHGSEDTRGEQLYHVAGKMLQQLEVNLNPLEIRKSMLNFFNEENTGVYSVKNHLLLKDSDLPNAVEKQAINFSNKLNDINKVPRADNEEEPANLLSQTIGDMKSMRAKRMAEIASIESMVRTKQEEAMMLQMQADEANGAALSLRRIISARQEKIEQDFAYKYAQLKLSEAEEKRKKMFEELQVLERAQHDYQKMKIMMEVQIKDLLMKLGVSKWQYV